MVFAIAVIVLLVSALFMLALRPMAIQIHLVDSPGGRKHHSGEIPMIGGLAMFLGVCVGFALLPEIARSEYLLLVAGALLVLTGVIDDRFELPASARFAAQLAAILVMVFGAGLVMRDIGDPVWIGRIHLGPLSLVITALIFSSVINAFNMADGLDGLAGSLAMVALLSIAIVSPAGSVSQVLAIIVSAAIGGFLLFNLPLGRWRPFRAFMGDAGSMFLGFVVVWLMVGLCQGSDRVISPVHGLWFAALPVFDLFACFTLRLRKGQSPFTSGRDHFHHVLLHRGMDPRMTLVTLVTLQLAYSGIGLAFLESGAEESLVFTVWAVAGIAQRKSVQAIGYLYEQHSLKRETDT